MEFMRCQLKKYKHFCIFQKAAAMFTYVSSSVLGGTLVSYGTRNFHTSKFFTKSMKLRLSTSKVS